jgi:hypothetical protein
MRPALDPDGHRVSRMKPTCLPHTWRPHRRRSFALVLHLHQHQSSRNLHLQYLAKNQSTLRCQSLIIQGSDHPPVLEPHMVLKNPNSDLGDTANYSLSSLHTWNKDDRGFHLPSASAPPPPEPYHIPGKGPVERRLAHRLDPSRWSDCGCFGNLGPCS